MVSPEDAERVALASTEGQILLTLRNPMDTAPTTSAGIHTANLLGQGAVAEAPTTPSPARARRVAAAPPPAPPSPPKAYTVEVIRGAKRTEETIK